jgi:hypothetical protein
MEYDCWVPHCRALYHNQLIRPLSGTYPLAEPLIRLFLAGL